MGYIGKYPTAVQKPANIKRVLLLGDSFTLGWGNDFDASFAGRLALELEKRQYEVINAAYKAGYSPDCYYAFYVKEGLELQPDILIMFIYTDNDIDDLQENTWHKCDENQAPLAIRTIRYYTNYRGEIIKVKHNELPWNYRIPGLNESRLFIGLTNFFIPEKTPLTFDVALERFDLCINAFETECKKRHLPIVYFLIPKRGYQLHSTEPHKDKHELIKQILAKHQCEFYDLQQSLSQDCYFEKDGHFNKKGSDITYEIVMQVIHKRTIFDDSR